MLKVYEVRPDVKNYRSLLPEEADILPSGLLDIDTRSLAATWIPPRVFCLHTRLEQGNFMNLVPGTLVATPQAIKKVRGFFEMAGEILPLPYEGQEYALLNITECINCLDQEKSEWLLTPTGQKALLKKYVFHRNRFTKSSLFKIPESPRAPVLTYERSCDPEEEFKAFVETEKMTGLKFQLLWESC